MDRIYHYIKKHIYIFLITLLFVIGFSIRLYKITHFPPVDIDEYGIAYNAYSILHYGVDEWGMKLPLFFKSFGDYKLPFDIYLVVIAYKLFGENVISLRLPSILFGSLYIPVMYLLLRVVLKEKKLAIVGVLLMTFSSYNLFFSRVISASISESFFIVASVTAFIYYIQYSRHVYLYIFAVLISISLYTYPSAWIVAPLLFANYSLLAIFRHGMSKHIFIITIIFGIALLPIAKQYFLGGSTVRVKNVGFFGADRGVVMEIDEFRAHDQNTLFAKVLHNKAVHYGYVFFLNYAKHFDFSYLAFGKQELIPQHSIDPPLQIVLIPFYYLGLFYLIRRRNWIQAAILLWVLVSPIPSAITEGAVNSKRYLSFMGSEIVVALFAVEILQIDKKKILSGVLATCVIFQTIFIVGRFYTTFIRLTEDYIYFKANILYKIVQENNRKTDTFVYSFDSLGEPQIYPLAATNYSPLRYNKIKQYTYEHLYVIAPFDKFYYSKEMNDIKRRITKDLTSKKRVMGLFDTEEKKQLNNFCFNTKKQYSMPITKRIYYLLEFTVCH